jgi:hypothetical protein
VLERVQRQLDVRRLRQLVPALHAHRDLLRRRRRSRRFRSEIWLEEVRGSDRVWVWVWNKGREAARFWPPDSLWTITTADLGGARRLHKGPADGEWIFLD